MGRTAALGWITVISAPAIIAAAGGFGALFGSRLAVTTAVGSSDGTISTGSVILLAFANVAPFFTVFALVRLRTANEYRFTQRPDLAALIFVLVAVNITLNNPISQARYWIATIVIAVAISGSLVRKPFFQLTLIVALIFASLVAFPYLDKYRKTDFGADSQTMSTSHSVVQSYLLKTDYASAADISNAIDYVSKSGHTDGRQLLGAVLFAVPRSLWPGKPGDTAKLLAIDIGYPNQNIDSPLWAEGYIDYGYTGAIVLLTGFGWAVARADMRISTRRPGSSELASVLVPALIGYELLLIRGSLLQAMGRLAMMILVGYLVSRRASSPGCKDLKDRKVTAAQINNRLVGK